EASNSANFDDLSWESFTNALVFAGDDFGGDRVGVEGAESTVGGGGVAVEMLDIEEFATPMFRFICISNSPT
ncbi:hypothetical protein A2U01_0103907, partial [Trifolium medium]|nr:hypothetical protein [Trifolium medium]